MIKHGERAKNQSIFKIRCAEQVIEGRNVSSTYTSFERTKIAKV